MDILIFRNEGKEKKMNGIKWLQEWLLENCFFDSDHYYKIRIESIDNPGWRLVIQLKNTVMENVEFKKIFIQREDENDWVSCRINEEKEFDSACGPKNLEEMINVFRNWCEKEK